MGLLSGLLTLPLAPVRGTVWVAEQVAAEAERQRDPRAAARRALAELELQHDLGEIGEDEYLGREAALLDQLATGEAGNEADA